MHRNSARNSRKTSSGFFFRTTHRIGSKISLCNSPGEALQDGISDVAIQPPVADISGWTDTQTDRHTEYTYYYIYIHLETLANYTLIVVVDSIVISMILFQKICLQLL